MNIKKARILHRRYNRKQWEEKDLRVGELGILLSDDGGSIEEIRVGSS
jgi:hypothetical protein